LPPARGASLNFAPLAAPTPSAPPFAGRSDGLFDRCRGLDFPIYLVSPEIAPREATPLHLAPHPTPWDGSPTPRRTLGSRIYGLGPTNGCIGHWGWVAKMGVLQEISGEMGQIPYHGQYQDFHTTPFPTNLP
jgi:hypothetical protein